MSYLFNADEVFEIAVQIEKNGAAFYRKAARLFSDKDRRQTLLELAEMEDNHEKTFEAMRAQLAGPEQEGGGADPDDQAALYLKMFSDNQVFDITKDPGEFITETTSLGEILMKAIGCERESILFYVGIKSIVPEALGRDKIDVIIREEVGHITVLNDHIDALGGV